VTTTRRLLAAVIALLAVGIVLPGCASPQMARGPVLSKNLADGVYRATSFQFPNRAVVEVTIEKQRVEAVRVVSHWAGMGYKAEGPVSQRIVEKQSTQVDAVTGATNSSQTIMKAAQKAIEKAYAK